MKKLEDIEKPCTLKVMSLDETSTTFRDVVKGHRLYDCVECPGTPGSCPNYADHYALIEKYGGKQ